EFKLLEKDANVFKLIGPVLVKQDQAEAKTNVDKRIEYIAAEIKRVEGQIKDLSERQDKKRQELQEIQIKFQESKQK
ncbi:Prefoldin subunit 6, partial [Dimargaris cristalligena]